MDRILSISINYINSKRELFGCINDTITLHQNVKSNEWIHMNELCNENYIPTRKNMERELINFAKSTKAGGKYLFHYSGHGSFQHGGNEKDRRIETLCPLDHENGQISDDWLRKNFIDLLNPNCDLYCIIDCCHSGTMLDLRFGYFLYPTDHRKRKFKTIYHTESQSTKANVICISGCMDVQKSADAYLNYKYQGALTSIFFTSLSNLKDKKQDITYHNVMKEILHGMRKNGLTQIPQISSGKYIKLEDTFSFS